MSGRKAAMLLPPILAALVIVALTLYAYRSLPARPFAADDYEWLLSMRGLSFGELVRRAFDPAAQTHFYRPLIWLLFWAQTRAFGLDPRGFHAVSLVLHLLNAFLLGWLSYRLTDDEGRRTNDEGPYPRSFVVRLSSMILITGIVALHPAPFEAVAWISAQSELLAAALLLAALHLWICRPRTNDERRTSDYHSSFVVRPWSVLATLALSLALLAKESAIIGLPLLILLGRGLENQEPRTKNQASVRHEPGTTAVGEFSILNSQFAQGHPILNFAPYLLPTLVTLAYVALQVIIEQRNYLLEQGGYGLGIQVVLNPLRSLALLVAPLPGTEHADAAWLVPLGALVALGLLGFWILDFGFWMRTRTRRGWSSVVGLPALSCSPERGRRGSKGRSSVVVLLALGLTLLPTAPFASPPDSRYLYLPVMAGAMLVGFWILDFGFTIGARSQIVHPKSKIVNWLLVLTLAWWATSELHAREGRFAAASGPGGSLWQVATWACAASRPERMVVVEPPVAAPHVEAIVGLACGADVRAKIVGRDQVAGAIKGRTLVIAFPNGSAEVQRWP